MKRLSVKITLINLVLFIFIFGAFFGLSVNSISKTVNSGVVAMLEERTHEYGSKAS